jgi:hypothetical protein
MREVFMQDEFGAKLGIFSDAIPPDSMSEMVGMKPDKSYIKGDHRGNTTIKQKENGWIIYSQVERAAPLQDHINSLLKRIENYTSRIEEIAKQPNVEIELGCTVWSGDRPPLYFTREQISILNKICASIDIDLYLITKGIDSREKQEY